MTKSKDATLHSVDPRIIELLRQAHAETFTFTFDTHSQAQTFIHKINRTRQLMRKFHHEYVPLADRVIIRSPRPIDDKWSVLVEPLGSEYNNILDRFSPAVPPPPPPAMPTRPSALSSVPKPTPSAAEDAIKKLFGPRPAVDDPTKGIPHD